FVTVVEHYRHDRPEGIDQARIWIGVIPNDLIHARRGEAHQVLAYEIEDIVLRANIIVDVALRDTRFLRHAARRRAVKALAAEYGDCRADDPFPRLVDASLVLYLRIDRSLHQRPPDFATFFLIT